MTEVLENTEIIEALRRKDEKAIRRLFDLHYASLCYFAETIVRDRQEAEDIAIQVFMRFLQQKQDFRSIESIRSWLFVSVKNAAIDFLRREKRQSLAEEELVVLGEPGDDMELLILKSRVLQAVYEEVENLGPQCRAVFKALFFEGKSTAEIAGEMGLSPQTVLNQKARAIRHLRYYLTRKGVLESVSGAGLLFDFLLSGNS